MPLDLSISRRPCYAQASTGSLGRRGYSGEHEVSKCSWTSHGNHTQQEIADFSRLSVERYLHGHCKNWDTVSVEYKEDITVCGESSYQPITN